MNIEKTKAQMRKGVLELCTMAIIAEKDAYASDIIDKLKSSDLIVVEGTLYPLLTRLKNEELLQYRWEESKSGPPRKYYQLTEAGEQSLDFLKSSWNSLTQAVDQIINQEPENK
ncbi:MAG: PadR family transcriptional regulator [Bacteroidetes bacterium 4572_77]|nr:MAG: PadR family transcriptional regulator [Bacteroidetes bacterium 4572_77]